MPPAGRPAFSPGKMVRTLDSSWSLPRGRTYADPSRTTGGSRVRWTRKFTATATTLAVPAAIALGLAVGPAGAQAATSTLCNSQTAAVAGGAYTVQNNEWGSGASECITTDGNADFSVANSSINNATNGAHGGYPSLYKGCHWGACTSGR